MQTKAMIEKMEGRMLLSASLTTLAQLPTVGLAEGGMVIDAQGDVFGVTAPSTTAYGTLYELPVGQTQVQTLLSAIEAQGSGPAAKLVIDPAGDIFGDMPTGGLTGSGVIFELPAGQQILQPLASYAGTNGGQLGNGVVRDPAGDIFVLAEIGSAGAGTGAILELPARQSNPLVPNTLITLATFPTGAAPAGTLAIDAAGDIFTSAPAGGVNSDGAIYELPATNRSTIELIASFGPTDPAPQGDLISDARGDLFGTTFKAATAGQTISTVFELPRGSNAITILGNDNNYNGSHIQPGVTRDSAGNLFGAIAQTQASSTVFEIPAGQTGMITLASAPQVQSGAANVNNINGFLGLDSAGNVYGTTSVTLSTTNPGVPGTSAASRFDTLFVLPGAAVPDTASLIEVAQTPTTAIVSTPIPAVTVDVLDSNGNVVSTNNSPISVQINSGPKGATLGGTLSVDAVAGVATFSNLTLDTVGTYTLSFTGPSLGRTQSSAFKITASPLDGSHLVISQAPTSAIAGSKISGIVVTAENSTDATSTTTKGKVTLEISTEPTGGKIIATKTTSLKKGVAVFSKISVDQSGSYFIQASDIASTPAQPITLTIVPATPKKMIFAQSPRTLFAGSTFAATVSLVDKFGNVIAGDGSTVLLTLRGGNKSAVLTGTLSQDVIDGVADFSGLSLATLGKYHLAATDMADHLKANSVSFRVETNPQSSGA